MIVKFNDSTLLRCEGVKLLPGVNTIDEKQYKALQAHPIFNALVEAGKITVYSDKIKGKEVEKLIPETFNKESLEALAEKSDSQKAKKAIEKQMHTIG